MNSRFTESLRPNRKLNLTTNTMMLLTHLAFILLYLKMKTPILFAYNLVSVAIFLVNYFFAWTRRDAIFYGVIYGEVLVFTTLNILLLGWGYGFELYSFSYAISIQLVAFFLFEEERVKNLYLIVGAIVTAYFLGMRLFGSSVIFPLRARLRSPPQAVCRTAPRTPSVRRQLRRSTAPRRRSGRLLRRSNRGCN